MQTPVLSRVLLVVMAILLAQSAHAQELDPGVLMRSVSSDVVTAIRRDDELQAGNQRKLIELVARVILPHVDASRMTRRALGGAWRQATPAQRQRLTLEFSSLLVHTYSSALATYHDRIIVVPPVRVEADDAEITVRSEIRQSGAQPLRVDFSMAKTPAGWKVYDITMGGVSLVSAYRPTFAEEVRIRGIDGLIDALSARNRQHFRRIDNLTEAPGTGTDTRRLAFVAPPASVGFSVAADHEFLVASGALNGRSRIGG